MVELVDCNVEVCNGRCGRHAHCDTTDLMEVSKSHSIIFHHDLHSCLDRLAVVLVPNVGKEDWDSFNAVINLMLVYIETASNVIILALGGRLILSSSCFSENESLK